MRHGGIVVAESLAGHAHLRHQRGELDVDGIARGGLVEQSRHHGGVVIRRLLLRRLGAAHRGLQGLRRDQALRRLADQAREGGAGNLELALGLGAGGPRAGEARFGLRHVGAGDFTHPEALIGGLQLAGEHLLVIDVQPHLLLRADDRDIGVGGVQHHALLHRIEAGALGEHPILRIADGGDGAPAAIDRLRHLDAAGGEGALLPLGGGDEVRSPGKACLTADDIGRGITEVIAVVVAKHLRLAAGSLIGRTGAAAHHNGRPPA